MHDLCKLFFVVLVLHSFALAQNSAFFARLERVCISVSINTDQPKDLVVEQEVLTLVKDTLRAASFPFIEDENDPRCSELTTGMMFFSAYGPNSYPGSVAPFETGFGISMPTPYEDIPRLDVYGKYVDAMSQEGDDATLYQTFKEQVLMWIGWFISDLQKAKAQVELVELNVPEK